MSQKQPNAAPKGGRKPPAPPPLPPRKRLDADQWVDITYVGETVKRYFSTATGREIGGSNRKYDGLFAKGIAP